MKPIQMSADLRTFIVSQPASAVVRAGNSIEWFKCNCGEESNLLWTFKSNKSRILACSRDCALDKAKAQLKMGYLVDA